MDTPAQSDRFALRPGDRAMMAVVTTGHGGYETLAYRAVPIPEPGPGEVLLAVLAAGVNNTEINTRVGWYAPTVSTGTHAAAEDREAGRADTANGGWQGATPFPFIQGTDCCGRVVTLGAAVDPGLLGARVLVRACMRADGAGSMATVWLGSDFDGAFAQFVKVPASEVFPVACDWSDAELGTIPCAYATAENLLHRAKIAAGEHLLVTGASGGVGSAAVQLAKRRGAIVTAIASRSKHAALRAIGADHLLDRGEDPVAALGAGSVDAAIDIVGGDGFGSVLKTIRRGGRYATSGAVGGPRVALDLRTLYLNDLTLIGGTAWDLPVFPNLVGYIERGEIKPLLAKTFPLEDIAAAQREFLESMHVGKLVLVPPPADLSRTG